MSKTNKTQQTCIVLIRCWLLVNWILWWSIDGGGIISGHRWLKLYKTCILARCWRFRWQRCLVTASWKTLLSCSHSRIRFNLFWHITL